MTKLDAVKDPPAVHDDDDSSGDVTSSNGHINFYQDVSDASILKLVTQLRRIDIEQQCLGLKLGLESPLPIHLHIHSYGGSVISCMAGVDAITRTTSPVYTYIEGGAASAATLLSIMGTKRFIGANSFMLIHQLSSAHWGNFEQLKDDMANNEQFMKRIKGLYLSRTKMKEKDLTEILKKDLWFDAKKALKLGLVDKVL